MDLENIDPVLADLLTKLKKAQSPKFDLNLRTVIPQIIAHIEGLGSNDAKEEVVSYLSNEMPGGLRRLVTATYSGEEEDSMLSQLGFPEDGTLSLSDDELIAGKDREKPNFDIFGPDVDKQSVEYQNQLAQAKERVRSRSERGAAKTLEKPDQPENTVKTEAPAASSNESKKLEAPAPAPAPTPTPAPARVPAPEPNLDNPAGLLAMAQNQGPINPKDKSLDAFQRSNIQKALNAQAARKIKDDIAKQRRSDRIQKIFDDREADLKESWARSRTGRMDGRPWDQLDEETKSEMRGRYMDARANSAYTDEKYKAYKEKTKDPLEKEYERKLKALQESRAMPPQDPFTEETKTDAMLTQPKGPESFELFFAEGPKNEPGYASSDSKPFSVDTTSKEDFGPRRKFIFTDPTRPEKPREPESFELFMPQNESGYASSDSKPFSVDTTSKDKFGPRRDLMTRPFPQPKSEPLNLFNITDQDVANTKQETVKQNAFADLEEAKQAEALRSQIADVRGQIQNQQDILDLKNKADRELDARYAAENAAKAARNAAYIEAQRMAKEKNVADTKNYYNQQVPVYGRRNDGTLGLMYDPNSYKAMKERSQVMKGIQNSKSGDPMADWQKEEEEKRRRKNQNIFG